MSFRLIFALLFACIPTALSASELTLTPQAAVAYALKQNPTLAAARLSIEEARARLQQSGRLSNPELELDFNKNTKSRESAVSVVLQQRFPLTSRLRYEKAVSRAQVSAAESEVRDAERKLAAEVRSFAVKLIALQAQQNLRNVQLANIRELSEYLRRLAATGEGASTDALQVELDARQIEIETLQLTTEAASIEGELRVLLGRSGHESTRISGVLAAPSAGYEVTPAAERPDILAAQARAEAAQLSVREQEARRFEDVGVGLSWSRERRLDEPNPIETEHTVGVRFSVPLPFWNTNVGRIREAEAAAARAQKELEATRFNAAAEAASARNTMDAYARIIEALDSKGLPQLTQLEEQLHASYSSGHTPLSEVLRARTRRLDLQRQRLDALRDYHLAKIRYTASAHP
jgi:cobalt-zinc-cadmium efflux system outer membrane protein